MASDEVLDPRFKAADFRVRIFLSVDLSGSTAFKNSKLGQELQGASPRWVSVFQQFYTDFPDMFRSKYQEGTTATVGADGCPRLWKAVGDELVFCGRVSSISALNLALVSFINTLLDYRKRLAKDGYDLNLKGASWLATFPEPNRAVQLQRKQGYDLFSASEALEAAADESPFDYDFLGKAIDTGFRIAASARPERFILSVQLARVLTETPAGAGIDHEIRIDRPAPLKGVNGGEPYPVLYIDTMMHLAVERVRIKERELMGPHEAPPRNSLAKYLEEYCAVVGTTKIELRSKSSDALPAPPATYIEHRALIEEHLRQEQGRERYVASGEADTAEPGNDEAVRELDETSGLRPLVTHFSPDRGSEAASPAYLDAQGLQGLVRKLFSRDS